ncbi:conserved hypothetical protein [gamma proteobacterium HTCC5015]|nr:conserved hypothetical protein [gamma proteobacterium HTCC5015]
MSLSIEGGLMVLALVAGFAIYWQQQRVGTIVEREARRFCRRWELQFLDDTVGCQKWRWRRSERGWKTHRWFVFEYSGADVERGSGLVYCVGDRVQQIEIQGHPSQPSGWREYNGDPLQEARDHDES